MLTDDLISTIPSGVKRAFKIPERELAARLRLELAVHLYEEALLSFGKSVELAQVSRWEFAGELAKRKIARHYADKDLEEDLAFANTVGENDGRELHLPHS